VLLYQLYNASPQDGVKKLLPDFVPLAMSVLAYAPVLKPVIPEAIRDLHAEFIGAQVKTLSFIAYILNKKLHEQFAPYKEQLPAFVLQLLHSAPSNCAQVSEGDPTMMALPHHGCCLSCARSCSLPFDTSWPLSFARALSARLIG
jgi:hypothetical protein